MAVRFDAAADRLIRTASVPSFNSAYTLMAWYRPASVSTSSHWATVMGLNNNADNTSNEYIQIEESPTAPLYLVGYVQGGSFNEFHVSTSIATPTVNVWHHLAMVRASATSLKIYINGADGGAGVTVDIGARTAASRLEFGADTSANNNAYNGRIAYIKCWQRALTATEIVFEMMTIRPQFGTSLWGYWPVWQDARTRDYSGNSRDLSESGTLTDEAAVENVAWGVSPYVLPFIAPPSSFSGDVAMTIATPTLTAAGDVVNPAVDPQMWQTRRTWQPITTRPVR